MFPGCPLCWAAASALVAPGVAGPAILAARNDFATWIIAAILGGTGILQRFGDMDIFLPWWWYAGVLAILYGRVAFLVIRALRVKKRDREIAVLKAVFQG